MAGSTLAPVRRRPLAVAAVTPHALEAIGVVAIAGLTVATRLLTRSHYLFNWDSIQFALGVQRFDLVAHRPHPPGYLGYILLGRLFTQVAGGDPQGGLVLLSAVAEGVAVLLAYLAARAIWGRFAGWSAAALLASSPLVWIYGGAALTYALEPAFAITVLWLAYRACQGSARALVGAAVVAALAGAIRPTDEAFLAAPVLWAAWRAWRAGRRAELVAAAAAMAVTSLLWLIPLLAASGGLSRYLVASRELSARATATSAVWKLGLEGLRINGSAVVFGLALSLGLFIPLGLADLVGRRLDYGHGNAVGTGFTAVALTLLLPALVVYDLVHIGQMGYLLLLLPAILLPAGVVIDNLARVVGGERHAPRLRRGAVAACVLGNIAIFALPAGGMRDQVVKHDAYVSALITTVQRFDPGSTVLVTEAEAQGSYRLAQYYLAEYPAFAVGRDKQEHAGAMFSTRGSAPEYDLARFDRTGPIAFPAGTRTVLVLDEAALTFVGDRGGLSAVAYGNGARLWVLHAEQSPVASGRWIYLQGQDCPCRGATSAKPIPVPGHAF